MLFFSERKWNSAIEIRYVSYDDDKNIKLWYLDKVEFCQSLWNNLLYFSQKPKSQL